MSVESISMVDMYVTYCPEEDTWHVKCNMEINSVISYDNWMKLLEKRKGWSFDEEVNGIVDSEPETVI